MPKTPPSKPKLTEQQALGLALKRLRKAADLTQEQAAERAGVVVQSWRRYEWGQRDLSLDKVTQLAAALGFNQAALLRARTELITNPPADRTPDDKVIPFPRPSYSQDAGLPIRDRVQAGAWLMVDDSGQLPQRRHPVLPDPRYPHADQWVAPVVGDSVNLLGIADGDLVQCVDAIGINYIPTTDDVVEVERLRFGGGERELTLKQVEVRDGVVLLWPRSTNQLWSDPIVITADVPENEDIEVRIRGLVVRSIKVFGQGR